MNARLIRGIAALTVAGAVAATFAAIAHQTPRQIPDRFQFVVQVPWSISMADTRTGGPLATGASLALKRVHEYNISSGDALPDALRRILKPEDVPLISNDEIYSLFGSRFEKSLAKELLTDTKGLHTKAVAGTYTVADAMELALEGTQCKYELLDDKVVYVFCRNHLGLALSHAPKADQSAK
jgi:hypothetical protein